MALPVPGNAPAAPRQPQASRLVPVIVASVASACLLALVCVGSYLFLKGEDVARFGTLGKAGTGTGFLGLAYLVVEVLRAVIKIDGGAERKRAVTSLVPLVLPIAVALGSGYVASGLKAQQALRKSLTQEVNNLNTKVIALEGQVQDLTKTREGILKFLGDVSRRENIPLIAKDVDWSSVVASVATLRDGARKHAVYGALLTAWKEVPFKLEGTKFPGGVNSPEFIRLVLNSAGTPIAKGPNDSSSGALMAASKRVDGPEPGDLVFYRGADPGSVGYFVMMYLAPGSPEGHGIVLGSYDQKNPVQVLDAKYFDKVKPIDPFIGYFRPPYTD